MNIIFSKKSIIILSLIFVAILATSGYFYFRKSDGKVVSLFDKVFYLGSDNKNGANDNKNLVTFNGQIMDIKDNVMTVNFYSFFPELAKVDKELAIKLSTEKFGQKKNENININNIYSVIISEDTKIIAQIPVKGEEIYNLIKENKLPEDAVKKPENSTSSNGWIIDTSKLYKEENIKINELKIGDNINIIANIPKDKFSGKKMVAEKIIFSKKEKYAITAQVVLLNENSFMVEELSSLPDLKLGKFKVNINKNTKFFTSTFLNKENIKKDTSYKNIKVNDIINIYSSEPIKQETKYINATEIIIPDFKNIEKIGNNEKNSYSFIDKNQSKYSYSDLFKKPNLISIIKENFIPTAIAGCGCTTSWFEDCGLCNTGVRSCCWDSCDGYICYSCSDPAQCSPGSTKSVLYDCGYGPDCCLCWWNDYVCDGGCIWSYSGYHFETNPSCIPCDDGGGGSGYCGDSSCNNGETCTTCATDCGTCGSPVCNNGLLDPGEECDGSVGGSTWNMRPECGGIGSYCNFPGNWWYGTPCTCLTNTLLDIGLRYYNGSYGVGLAADPLGSTSSPLRIKGKDSNIYGLTLVDSNYLYASKIKINTSSGVKSLMKIGIETQCCTAAENASCTVTCSAGKTISRIKRAKYGASTCSNLGACNTTQGGDCSNPPTSCIGQNSCTFKFTGNCADTCVGYLKTGYLTVECE